MRLGINFTIPHSAPQEWAAAHAAAGLRAVVFPCDHTAPTALIDGYVQAAAEHDLLIAEVGCWSNPLAADTAVRTQAISLCKHQLELAEYVGARCCVNIAGTPGERWDGAYPENFAPATFALLVTTVQDIIDSVRPVRTRYTLEPMPHQVPMGPEQYLRVLQAIDRPATGVHMDIVNWMSSPQRYFGCTEFIRQCFSLLGDKTVCCHLKDCAITHRLPVGIAECECGEGGFDIPTYLAEADAVSPDMPVLIEHLTELEQYYRAIRYVQRLWNK